MLSSFKHPLRIFSLLHLRQPIDQRNLKISKRNIRIQQVYRASLPIPSPDFQVVPTKGSRLKPRSQGKVEVYRQRTQTQGKLNKNTLITDVKLKYTDRVREMIMKIWKSPS